MQDSIRSADIEDVFKEMATSIEVAMDNPASARIDKASLTTAKDFFSKLHVLFTDLVEASKRRTGINIVLRSASSGLRYV